MNILKEITKDVTVSVLINIITDGIKLIKTMNSSTITISDWSSSYQKINKLIYKLDKDKYNKHKKPTTNKQYYELELGTSYFINRNDITIKVESYKEPKQESLIYPQKKIKITFFGNNKYEVRMKFLQYCMKVSDKYNSPIKFLNENEITNLIISHDFDHIIIPEKTKNNIINGLMEWSNSKNWYRDHQMIHKIGVFLYGSPGTGKTSIVRAISNMFNNAVILTLDINNIMNSIDKILKIRKKINSTIIVLLEDFDMYFRSREQRQRNDGRDFENHEFNQNAIFQLLDGMYSTENTIYIATTNYKDRIDPALIRYGRFDIQEELKYFDKDDAKKAIKLFGYDNDVLESFELEYPIQPSKLRSKILEYRSYIHKEGGGNNE